MTPEKAQLIGHLMADGHVSMFKNGPIVYVQKEKENTIKFAKLFNRIYDGAKFNINLKKGKNPTWRFAAYSVKIWNDLQQYGSFHCKEWRIPKEIMNGSESIKKPFLKAFIIDEGHLTSNSRVEISSTNKWGAKQLVSLAKSINFFDNVKMFSYRSNGGYIYYKIVLYGNLISFFPNLFSVLSMTKQKNITVKKETRNELQIRKLQKQGREKRLMTWDEFLLEATEEN